MPQAVTRDRLGAWMVRCNPGVWRLHEFIADGNDYLESWSLRYSYRCELMRPGDKILLWVTASPHMPRGIWGIGHVTGHAGDRIIEVPEHAEDDGYWVNEQARIAADYGVNVHIEVLSQPVTSEQLLAAGIDNLEVQSQPQMANPLWLTADQLSRVETLLPDWPPYVGDDEDPTPGLEGDPLSRYYCERAAVDAVSDWYEDHGWVVEDVGAQKLGWDLTCSGPNGETAKVEVKGLSGSRPVILLTANELRAARQEPGWTLSVVTRALTAPECWDFSAAEAVAVSAPHVYRADLTDIADAPSCTACGEARGRRIVYGLPTAEVAADHPIGGCLVSPTDPEWECPACAHRW